MAVESVHYPDIASSYLAMARQNPISLLMDAPQEVEGSGRVPSACLHPTKDLAMSAYDNSALVFGDYQVRCRIFNISGQALNPVPGSQSNLSNSGRNPSLTMITKNDKTMVIAIYCTVGNVFTDDLRFRIGTTNDSNQITWRSDDLLESGYLNPKISASKNGTVAVIYEQSKYFGDNIWLKLGTAAFTTDSSTVPSIKWKYTKLIDGLHGVNPDVAISDTAIVVICGIGKISSHLQTKVGTIHPDLGIVWGQTVTLPSTGLYPAISINSKGFVVEIHQTKTRRLLVRNCGTIIPDEKIIAWTSSNPKPYTTGEYSTVSINDDNSVFEMHKSNFGLKLFYSQGKLCVL